MIVLCANCHGRKGNGPGQIDRKSLLQYKANLAVINSRYSDLERRVLEVLAEQITVVAKNVPSSGQPIAPDWQRGLSVALPGTMRLLMMYLVKDGYVEIAAPGTDYITVFNGSTIMQKAPIALNGHIPDVDYYRLTHRGVEFVEAFIGARPLDD